MNVVRIIACRVEPWTGRHIPEQSCEYLKTSEGLPAIRVEWKGLFFGRAQGTFVFARDASSVARLSDEKARIEAKVSTFFRGGDIGTQIGARSGMAAGGLGTIIGGLLGTLVAGSASLALSRQPSEIKGFAVSFLNEKGGKCYFMAVATPAVVEEVLACIPVERMKPDDDPLL